MRILVTGGTGMLGSELVPKLLERGHTVYVLSRHPGRSQGDRLFYVKGDVTKPHLGNTSFTQPIDAVAHLAALTSLRDRNRPEVMSVNYIGTQNVVYFCLGHGISQLFHISTLYICGDHKDNFAESDFSVGQSFKNSYEESKYNAEGFVRNHPVRDVQIFRPGILVGRHSDGHAALFEGFYRPLKAIVAAHVFAEQKLGLPPREWLEDTLHLPPLTLPIRIYGDPNSTLALTPVDWATDVIADAITNAKPYDSGRVYHVVPSSLPTMNEIAESVCESLAIRGLHVMPEHTHNPLDMFYNRLIRDFRPYLHDQPVFQTSVGQSCPPVDRVFIKRIVAYWREHDKRPLDPEREMVSADLRAS